MNSGYIKIKEFAFIDVFNKESFYENAQIVIEMIRLLQAWQIRYSKKQQFLGEFFELLLNTGFKQESGQFFTPVPLVKFILYSLPIKDIVLTKLARKDENFLPYIIDFACGSGHFVTESMDYLQNIVNEIDEHEVSPIQKRKLNSYRANEYGWAKEYVYGIERDYRLAKTSKLAAFLNGDGDARIVHGSGIAPFSSDHYDDRLTTAGRYNEAFDVLVANPPYAVKGFKSTVVKGEESFELFNRLSDKSDKIEVLFIERMAQLMKPGGVVGIILPRSILNGGSIYEDARRVVYENFEIKAIVVLGSKAFMETGINTVIFFLKETDCKNQVK